MSSPSLPTISVSTPGGKPPDFRYNGRYGSSMHSKLTSRLVACITLPLVVTLISCGENQEPVAKQPGTEADSGIEDQAMDLLSTLDTREKVGQLLFVDLWTEEGIPLRELTDSLAEQLEDLNPGGFIFYGANLKNPEQIRNFTGSLTAVTRVPPFLAVDHEGGTVNRLDDSGEIPATEIPAAATIGGTGEPDFAYRAGRVMGEELSCLGFNMNFAPVADVLSSPDSMIGTRSFGSDPRLVAAMVREMVTGIQETGVSSVLKHFPGHGGAVGDTHATAVYLDRGIEDLFSRELVPFAAGVEAGTDAIMVAHIILGNSAAGGTPATLSPDLLTGVIRERLGFGGLVITDSMHMKALSGAERPAVDAILAGADMLLTPRDEYATRAQILAALEDGSLSIERIDESVLRIIRTKLKRGLGSDFQAARPEVLGSEEHRQVAEAIQRFHSSGE